MDCRTSDAVGVFIFCVAVSGVLLAANGFDVSLLPLFTGLSALLSISLYATVRSNREAYGRKTLKEGIASCLYGMAYYKSRKGSYLGAIDRASKSHDSKEVRDIAESAKKKYWLGGNFLSELLPPGFGRADKSILIRDDCKVVRSVLCANELRDSENQSRLEESVQRYAVFNMFISTVAPSFLVFAFVGGSILSTAQFNLVFFSSVMLVAIPIIYSLGNSLMWRRFFD
ncbi:Uncharacterised protein [uncultured archaeon]|nr:Uncharacterised protein [uncultured archaeon]